jgi:hypothetical protein
VHKLTSLPLTPGGFSSDEISASEDAKNSQPAQSTIVLQHVKRGLHLHGRRGEPEGRNYAQEEVLLDPIRNHDPSDHDEEVIALITTNLLGI